MEFNKILLLCSVIMFVSVLVYAGIIFCMDSNIPIMKKIRDVFKHHRRCPSDNTEKYQSKNPIKAISKQSDKLEGIALSIEDEKSLSICIFELCNALDRMKNSIKKKRSDKEMTYYTEEFIPELIVLLENYRYAKDTGKGIKITDEVTGKMEAVVCTTTDKINRIRQGYLSK